jgi:hypothetical protein
MKLKSEWSNAFVANIFVKRRSVNQPHKSEFWEARGYSAG